MLAEDDDALRELLVSALKGQGFQVRAAPDGVTALRFLEVSMPQVVVLDLVLPLASGFEILQELRSGAAAGVPVIAISGDEDGLSKARQGVGFFATLRKPFDPHTLVRTVSRAMRQVGA